MFRWCLYCGNRKRAAQGNPFQAVKIKKWISKVNKLKSVADFNPQEEFISSEDRNFSVILVLNTKITENTAGSYFN